MRDILVWESIARCERIMSYRKERKEGGRHIRDKQRWGKNVKESSNSLFFNSLCLEEVSIRVMN